MTQTAINNAVVLYLLDVALEEVQAAEEALNATPYLMKVLSNPVIKKTEKHSVIEKIFTGKMKNFILSVSDRGQIGSLPDIFKAFYKNWDEKNDILRALAEYATEFGKEDEAEVMKILEKNYPGKKIILTTDKNTELIGGFVIHAGYDLYDKSYDGMLRQLEAKLSI